MDLRASFILASLFTLACTAGGDENQGLSGSGGASAGASDASGSATTSPASGSTSADTSDTTTSGTPSSTGADDSSDTDETTTATGSTSSDGDSTGGATTTGMGTDESSTGTSDSSGIEDGVLDIGIIAHNDCTFTVEPSTITVPKGTAFTVNWISSPASEVEFDVAKIDPFNQVPIIIGMEPGTTYHDDVREWCGNLFTGTFDFRLTSCFEPTYIPVDCGG